MRRRVLLTFVAVGLVTLASASPALATTYGGQGIWGSTNDETITYAMFIVMALIGAIIVLFTLIQLWLEHRHHARLDAAKNREDAAEWKGGW